MNTIFTSLLLIISIGLVNSQVQQDNNLIKQDYEYFLDFFTSKDNQTHNAALKYIDTHWSESFEIMAVESIYLLQSPANGLKLLSLLQKKTKKHYGYEFNEWFEYVWNKHPTYNDQYYKFKAKLHSFIDPKFEKYFIDRQNQSEIRLDEVRWGGVIQDGIPPLRNPKMISAKQATYLKDNHIVFGILVNGDARAYPKRILAWHEMFTDTVGNTAVAGVYCTLCGTVILYKTEKDGVQYQLGTSGFLYRSNKLMYDQKTQSLWNTLWGKPVIGPLINKGIELEYLSVVTTTWGDWKKRHPQTKVLSLQTGHQRDYGEGIAYQDYFSTDELMFSVSVTDKRLKNKQEILAIRLPSETEEALAISSKFLRKKHVYQGQINHHNFTVFTDKTGAHRVYFTEDIKFDLYDKQSSAIDTKGNTWTLKENELENTSTQQKLKRLPTHNAFWFGFKAAFPNVKLIK